GRTTVGPGVTLAHQADARAGFDASRDARRHGFAPRLNSGAAAIRTGTGRLAGPATVAAARRAAEDALLLAGALANRATDGFSRRLTASVTGLARFATVDLDRGGEAAHRLFKGQAQGVFNIGAARRLARLGMTLAAEYLRKDVAEVGGAGIREVEAAAGGRGGLLRLMA